MRRDTETVGIATHNILGIKLPVVVVFADLKATLGEDIGVAHRVEAFIVMVEGGNGSRESDGYGLGECNLILEYLENDK